MITFILWLIAENWRTFLKLLVGLWVILGLYSAFTVGRVLTLAAGSGAHVTPYSAALLSTLAWTAVTILAWRYGNRLRQSLPTFSVMAGDKLLNVPYQKPAGWAIRAVQVLLIITSVTNVLMLIGRLF